jgi:putative membrane protein
MMWNDYWDIPWMFGPLMMLVFVALCMTMMWFMMRGMHGRRSGRNGPIDILKERFARGELTETEYNDRRRILEA